MPEICQWKDDYKIGITEIDSQHQKLFEIARAFETAETTDQGKHALMEVYQYTREHFHLEEEFMKSVNYPGYEQHKEKHDELIDQLNTLAYNYDGDLDERQHIISFFSQWISQHICNEDYLLAVYSNDQH